MCECPPPTFLHQQSRDDPWYGRKMEEGLQAGLLPEQAPARTSPCKILLERPLRAGLLAVAIVTLAIIGFAAPKLLQPNFSGDSSPNNLFVNTTAPSPAPTDSPTYAPTALPTEQPTPVPSMPTAPPSMQPSPEPTIRPTPSPSLRPSSSSAPSPQILTCAPYTASNTNSDLQNYATCSIYACSSTVITASMCSSATGAGCTGDTYLRLYSSSNALLVSTDDGCGLCSLLTYTVPSTASCTTYSLHEGCYASNSCGGTVVVTLTPSTPYPSYSPVSSPTDSESSCFSGSQTVLLDSGRQQAMADTRSGDRVLVYSPPRPTFSMALISGGSYTGYPVQVPAPVCTLFEEATMPESPSNNSTIEIADVSRNGGSGLGFDNDAAILMAGQGFQFADIVVVPHKPNRRSMNFTVLETASGRRLELTGDHLIPASSCEDDTGLFTQWLQSSPPPPAAAAAQQSALRVPQSLHSSLAQWPTAMLKRAADVRVHDCIMTVSGPDAVTRLSWRSGEGAYTLVPSHGLLVVNGIVASPHARYHALADWYYMIHRTAYALQARWLLDSVGFDYINSCARVLQSLLP